MDKSARLTELAEKRDTSAHPSSLMCVGGIHVTTETLKASPPSIWAAPAAPKPDTATKK
jgi:hypothetical protein